MLGFDSAKYTELASKVDYTPRTCSDGLCCFLYEEEAKKMNVKQNGDIVLLRRNILLITIVDLVADHLREYQACEHLRPGIEIKDGKLKLEFRCAIYDNGRPDDCMGYPGEDECEHSRLSRVQQMYFPDIWHFISFSADKFPEMEEFAYETKGKFFRVPLPLLKP
jgi:hypothetical protein